MAFSLPPCLEGQHPGVASSLWTLRLAFCGYHLMKLPVEDLWGVYFSNYLSSCLIVHRGLPLIFLLWLEPVCAVLWREHTVVGNLQFLCNFSHGIAFISQNKNRLSNWLEKENLLLHFERIIEPTNADAPDTQLAQRKASCIDSLISTTDFSCANIIAQGFSNDQLAF